MDKKSICVFCGRTEEQLLKDKLYLLKGVEIPVKFYYDQNDSKTPIDGGHIEMCEVNACKECLMKGSGFVGFGALGKNNYSLVWNSLAYDKIEALAEERTKKRVAQKEQYITCLESQLAFARKHPVKQFFKTVFKKFSFM